MALRADQKNFWSALSAIRKCQNRADYSDLHFSKFDFFELDLLQYIIFLEDYGFITPPPKKTDLPYNYEKNAIRRGSLGEFFRF